MPASNDNEERVLVLAPLGRDGPVTAQRLRESGFAAAVCADAAVAARELAAGAGALLLTEEALEEAGAEGLFAQLHTQPPWSEPPLIILTRGGESRVPVLLDRAARAAGAITLLERPLGAATLLRTVEVALRARRRQYQARDLIEQQRRQNAALQAARVAALNLADDADRARRQAEQAAAALRESEQRLRRVSDTAGVGLTRLSRDWRYLSANPAYAGIAGVPLERIIGHTAVEVMGKAAVETIRPYVERVLRGERVEYETELPLAVRGSRHIHANYTPETDAAGQVVGWVASISDITERKKLERALIEATEREQRKFGHELHDSLGQRLTGLEMLSHVLAEDLKDHAKELAKQARRLNVELRETVSEARLISHSLAPVPLDGDGLMRGLTELASRTNRHKGVKCRFRCEPPVHVEDTRVATHLYRIAQEAVTNALKHGKARKIDISLKEASDVLELCVENNGHPLPADDPSKNGIGLNAMRYRAGLIGAVLSIKPGTRKGVKVWCTLRRKP